MYELVDVIVNVNLLMPLSMFQLIAAIVIM